MERKKTGERKIYRKVKMHLRSRGRKASAQFVSKVHYPPPRKEERGRAVVQSGKIKKLHSS